MLTLLTALLCAQAPGPSTWVTLSKRSGLTGPAALSDVASVKQALGSAGVDTSPAPADLTRCQKKLPCLLKAARKEQVRFLVLVDTARVLEQAVVKVELLSVDEDGKKLAGFLVDEVATAAPEQLRMKTTESLGPVLRSALGLANPEPVAPPPAPAPVPVVVVAPPPPPVEIVAPVAPEPPRASGLRVVSYVVGGLGLAAAGVGAFFGFQTLAAAQERDRLCPPSAQCDVPRAFSLDEEARQRQTLGFIVGGAGAALVATSVVLFFVSAPSSSPTRAALVPSRDGWLLSLSTSW